MWACGALVLSMFRNTLNGYWLQDFWEHSAVVRELATHPLRPHHPLLALEATPHSSFSPYHLAIGLVSRLTGLDAVVTLSVVGLLNLLLLLYALRRFVASFCPRHAELVSFYGLIFILFLWPANTVWNWSGFLHFRALGFVLPYPSTFAIAATLLLLTWYHDLSAFPRKLRLALLTGLTAIIMLTHPPTAGFALAGVVAIAWHSAAARASAVARALGLLAAAFALTLLWPYYPVLRLTEGADRLFQGINSVLYGPRRLIQATYPLLLVVPFSLRALIQRAEQQRTASLLTLLGLLCGLYVGGYLAGQLMLGRLLSPIGMIVQLGFAMAMVDLELALRRRRLWLALPLALVLASLLLLNRANVPVLARAVLGHPNSYADYEFLRDRTGQYEVILAELRTGWKIPTFGGKLVASYHPLHWVPDHEERKRALARFFDPATDLRGRQQIVEAYGVDYVLLDKLAPGDRAEYHAQGHVIAQNQRFELLRLSPSTSAATPDRE